MNCTPEECAITTLEGFEARLRVRFPAISPLQPTGHDDKITLAHVLGVAALDLQAEAGCPVTFRRTAPTVESGVFQVVVEYSEEAVGPARAGTVGALLWAAKNDTLFDLQQALQPIERTRRRGAPGPQHRLHRGSPPWQQHSVPPHDRRQHDHVWLGQQAAPHPGRRDRQRQRHLRGHAQDKAPHQEIAGGCRRAGARWAREVR